MSKAVKKTEEKWDQFLKICDRIRMKVHAGPDELTDPTEKEKKAYLKDISDLLGCPTITEKHLKILSFTTFWLMPYSSAENSRAKVEQRRFIKKANNKKSHIDKAIDTLTITTEELKDKEILNKKEIRKLSKTLQEAVGDIYYFIGVAPQAIEECYRMTAKYLKDTSSEKRAG